MRNTSDKDQSFNKMVRDGNNQFIGLFSKLLQSSHTLQILHKKKETLHCVRRLYIRILWVSNLCAYTISDI